MIQYRFNALLRHFLSGYCAFRLYGCTEKETYLVLLVVGRIFKGMGVLAHSHC